MTIEQAENRNLLIGAELVIDSQDVKAVLKYLAKEKFADDRNIDGLFVKQSDGDYDWVYGFTGIVPYNNKELLRIKGAITKK